jgi:hypothetical protein
MDHQAELARLKREIELQDEAFAELQDAASGCRGEECIEEQLLDALVRATELPSLAVSTTPINTTLFVSGLRA